MKLTIWQRWLALTVTGAALLCFALSARAQPLPPIGGPGGSPFIARCPQGQHLNGFELRAANDVDAIRPICVTAYGPSDVGPPVPGGIWFGGDGGSPRQLVCPSDMPIVIKMVVDYGGIDTKIVYNIYLWCGTATATQTLTEFPNAVFGASRQSVHLPAQACPAGLVAVGINGRSGIWLDALGLICGAPQLSAKPTPPPPPPPVVKLVPRLRLNRINDFNGDGQGDILWYNAATGEAQIWFMNGSSRIGRAAIIDAVNRNIDAVTDYPTRIGPPWSIVGSNDFNGDGKIDLLWHNAATGETQIWFLNGNALSGRATVIGEQGTPAFVGLPWSIVGSNDFNQDGRTDILWHNASTGETQIWFMNGYKVSGRATVLGEQGTPAFVGLPWSIVGSNDFNQDGKTDILWHNASTGETQIWFMNGYTVIGRATVLDEKGSPIFFKQPWRIVGTNDFNLDGKGDILWYNANTGETQIWLMNGRVILLRATVDAARDGGVNMVKAPWSIVNH